MFVLLVLCLLTAQAWLQYSDEGTGLSPKFGFIQESFQKKQVELSLLAELVLVIVIIYGIYYASYYCFPVPMTSCCGRGLGAVQILRNLF